MWIMCKTIAKPWIFILLIFIECERIVYRFMHISKNNGVFAPVMENQENRTFRKRKIYDPKNRQGLLMRRSCRNRFLWIKNIFISQFITKEPELFQDPLLLRALCRGGAVVIDAGGRGDGAGDDADCVVFFHAVPV